MKLRIDFNQQTIFYVIMTVFWGYLTINRIYDGDTVMALLDACVLITCLWCLYRLHVTPSPKLSRHEAEMIKLRQGQYQSKIDYMVRTALPIIGRAAIDTAYRDANRIYSVSTRLKQIMYIRGYQWAHCTACGGSGNAPDGTRCKPCDGYGFTWIKIKQMEVQ